MLCQRKEDSSNMRICALLILLWLGQTTLFLLAVLLIVLFTALRLKTSLALNACDFLFVAWLYVQPQPYILPYLGVWLIALTRLIQCNPQATSFRHEMPFLTAKTHLLTFLCLSSSLLEIAVHWAIVAPVIPVTPTPAPMAPVTPMPQSEWSQMGSERHLSGNDSATNYSPLSNISFSMQDHIADSPAMSSANLESRLLFAMVALMVFTGICLLRGYIDWETQKGYMELHLACDSLAKRTGCRRVYQALTRWVFYFYRFPGKTH